MSVRQTETPPLKVWGLELMWCKLIVARHVNDQRVHLEVWSKTREIAYSSLVLFIVLRLCVRCFIYIASTPHKNSER